MKQAIGLAIALIVWAVVATTILIMVRPVPNQGRWEVIQDVAVAVTTVGSDCNLQFAFKDGTFYVLKNVGASLCEKAEQAQDQREAFQMEMQQKILSMMQEAQ